MVKTAEPYRRPRCVAVSGLAANAHISSEVKASC
jgi:hypothetical protein